MVADEGQGGLLAPEAPRPMRVQSDLEAAISAEGNETEGLSCSCAVFSLSAHWLQGVLKELMKGIIEGQNF